MAFNLVCEVIFVGFWHWLTYVSSQAQGMLPFKFNPNNQYEKSGPVKHLSSSSGQLEREIKYTTLGWLQSGAWQCFMMWAWSSGRLSYQQQFWTSPLYNLFLLGTVTYWREVHFYWCHRGMHPWFDQ